MCNNIIYKGIPGDSDGKEFTCNAGDLGSIPGWEDPLEKGQLPTPVFLPGEFHGQRSLAGYSLWGHKESGTTEWLTHTQTKIRHCNRKIGKTLEQAQKSRKMPNRYMKMYSIPIVITKLYTKTTMRTLEVQWIRIHLPMQRSWVQSPVWEDSTCCKAIKPLQHNS